MKALQFPLTRITIAFILGILVVYFTKPNPWTVFLLLAISTFFCLITYFLSKTKIKKFFYFGIATYLIGFTIGATSQIIHTDSYQQNNYIHYKAVFDKTHTFTLIIREKLKGSPTNERFVVLLNSIDQKKVSGRILLNIRKDSLNHNFQIGDRLKITSTLYKSTSQKNPNQFDYQKYLQNKQIYAQLYTDVSELKVSTNTEKDIWYYTAKMRSLIIQNLEKSNFNTNELNVAVALIMGQQQDISPEIIRDYQYAGAIHILSISGLHIGFILLFVTFILKPFPNSKRGNFIKLIIIISSLVLFGILAGLAPSVLRSVTMFSFVTIGQFLRRGANIYHTLLVSMLLILLFQPSFLFDVGFQLSYVALFFIIWLQPLLAQLWTPKNKIKLYIWNILTVSFAAQIGTLPLSIYYFHQFPGLFFVTNLIVIPFLSFIMALGSLVMIFAAFNWVPFYPAKVLEWSIYFLNKIISSIASFEQFILKDIPLNTALLITTYLVLITTVIWCKKPTGKKLLFALVSILLLQIITIKTKWEVQSQDEFIVFNNRETPLITTRKGNKVTLYANDSLLKNFKKNMLLSSYLCGNFSTLESKKRLENFIYFKGNKIAIIDSSAIYPIFIKPDILLLTQSPKINLGRLLLTTKPKIVVADGSNYNTLLKLWKATCAKNKIPFHATSEKGFYILN